MHLYTPLILVFNSRDFESENFIANVLPFFKAETRVIGSDYKNKFFLIRSVFFLINHFLFVSKRIEVTAIVNLPVNKNGVFRYSFLFLLLKILKIRILLMVYGKEEPPLYLRLLLKSSLRPDSILVSSAKLKQQIENIGYNEVYLNHRPIQFDTREWNIKQEINDFIFIIPTENKGNIKSWLEAFRLAQLSFPFIKIIIISAIEDHVLRYTRYIISRLQIKNVRFTVLADHACFTKELKNAQVMLLPSSCAVKDIYDVLEAMAYGQVIVANALKELTELYETIEFGYLIDKTESEKLSDILIELIDKPIYYLEKRTANIAYVQKHCDPSIISTKIEDLITN